MKKLFLFLCIIVFASCSSDDDNGDDKTDYFKVVSGTWVNYKEDCSTCLNEEFTFTDKSVTYKEYYTGTNGMFSADIKIDKDSIYIDQQNLNYKYSLSGNKLTLISKTKTHKLIKK